MKISRSISVFEKSILKSDKLFILISQIAFFHSAESALLPQGQKATSLFTLMLFNALTYCITYLYKIISNTAWCSIETVATTSQVPHLAISATKLTLEWTKFIVFFITTVSICLALTLGVSMQGFSPTPGYLALTGLYFLSQEKMVVLHMPRMLARYPMYLSMIEGEESVWSPIILKIFSLILSSILVLLCMSFTKYKNALTTFTVCVYLKFRDLQVNGLEKLKILEKHVSRFPLVPTTELLSYDDVCSICLSTMRRARRTYCGHIFHPVCLARAMKIATICPLCKQKL